MEGISHWDSEKLAWRRICTLPCKWLGGSSGAVVAVGAALLSSAEGAMDGEVDEMAR